MQMKDLRYDKRSKDFTFNTYRDLKKRISIDLLQQCKQTYFHIASDWKHLLSTCKHPDKIIDTLSKVLLKFINLAL